jgi:hypothetical protein
MSDSDTRTLYVVVHNPNGGIGHQQIGQALVEADFDATLTKLALRLGCEPLASFTIYSRRQAAAAIQELEDLGDVDVDPRDFARRSLYGVLTKKAADNRLPRDWADRFFRHNSRDAKDDPQPSPPTPRAA